jgi:hypothetical protein
MGSGLDKMYDDYDDYEYICKKLGEKATRGYTDFLSHQYMILTKHGFKDKYDYFEYLNLQEKRDKKIDSILGES